MKVSGLASVSVVAIMAAATLAAAPAQARGGKGMSFSSHSTVSTRSFSNVGTRSIARATIKPSKLSNGNATARRLTTSKLTVKKATSQGLAQNGSLRSAKLNLAKLPMQKSISGNANLAGRLAVPKNLKPKLTLAQVPNANFKLRLAPFVQRYWKKSFFWVAVAGIGYLTIPELYYDRFYGCTTGDYPDYEACIRILSHAAIEEDAVYRVRTPMPAGASYRYTAKVAPTADARQTCSLEPFVERKWNREFVWVQVPETGNVTVPEDTYDLFQDKISAAPPDYAAACRVLTEAAAADTVMTTAMDTSRAMQ